MISEHNFTVHKDGESYNMHDVGVWVNYLQISSPNTSYEKVKVPNSRKTLLTNHEEGTRSISIELLLEADTIADYEYLVHKVYEIFFSGEEVRIERDSHLGESIYAVLEGEYSPEDITTTDGEINFEMIMIDPVIYGPENKYFFNDGVAQVNNRGSVEASPIIEIDITGDVTHVDVISDDGFLRVGEAAALDEVVFEPLTKVLDLPLTNTIGWTNVTSLDHGYVGGSMGASAPLGFRPTLYGAALLPRDWQGPALRRTLPDPLQDFRFDLDVELLNGTTRSGMIELFGLDALNRVVFVLGIEDISQTQSFVQGKFQVGGKTNRLHEFIAKPDARYPKAWNDFKGTIRIHRRGNRITPYWSLVDSKGNHVWKYSTHSYIDLENRNTAPITQLIIAMRKWPTTPEALMAARNLRAFRYNEQPEGIPIIASQGDKMLIDMEKSLVKLNGEDYEEIAFGSEYFDIKKGASSIVIEPSDKLTATLTFRERKL